ncbi:MAG TPA: c-type cytochrome [Rhodocyclaceae bacterium]|nr:c-type cytochrome [Rhodocyclaceae bacterium]
MSKTSLIALVTAGLVGGAAAHDNNIEVLARTCNGCHGVGGVSAGPSMPSIGGLPRDYLARIMKQWKYDERVGVTMNRIVKGFSDDELDALAGYFSRQPWVPAPQRAPADVMQKGRSAVSESCEDCHGISGNDPDVDAPRINGQWSRYMELELEKFRSADFKMPHRKMRRAANEMKPADVSAAARYFGAQSR